MSQSKLVVGRWLLTYVVQAADVLSEPRISSVIATEKQQTA